MTGTAAGAGTVGDAGTAEVGGVVLLDGTSGAGKTTLAHDWARVLGAHLIHMDDLYAGWDGLAAGTATVERILQERAAGHSPRWRRWDWHVSAWGEEETLDPAQALIIEGCGSVTEATAAHADQVIWMDGPEELRRLRIRVRDGDDSWWEGWKEQEAAHCVRHSPHLLATRTLSPDRLSPSPPIHLPLS